MNRIQITVLLLIVLFLSVVYAWMATPKQRRVAQGQSNPRKENHLSRSQSSPPPLPVVADLNFFDGGDGQYQKNQRDIFEPLYLSPKVATLQPMPHPVAKVSTAVASPNPIIQIVTPRQGSPSIQPLNILGFLNKTGTYTVFLSSTEGNIYLVKAGDVFADDLVVESISSKKIVIGRKKTDQRVTLLMGEVKSQRLPKFHFRSDRPQFKMPTAIDSNKLRAGGIPEMFKTHQQLIPVNSKTKATHKSDKKADK